MAEPKKQRAPTLYVIIALKLLKGTLLILLGLGVYHLADKDLTEGFQTILKWVHLDPEKKFFTDLGDKINRITPKNIYWVATGTVFYSMFSFVEGVGLLFRVSWAGWMAVGESIFFIPVEIYELMHRFSWAVTGILLINIWIAWYLLQNRHRLFRHHLFKT